MKVKIDAVEMTFSWKHMGHELYYSTKKHLILKEDSIAPPQTICTLKINDKLILTATVSKYYKDPYDKNEARRFALRKLLKNAGFSRITRSRIWKEYLNRSKKTESYAKLIEI